MSETTCDICGSPDAATDPLHKITTCEDEDCIEAALDSAEPTVGPCVACGRNPALGYAATDAGWYCHGDDEPSCYETRGMR